MPTFTTGLLWREQHDSGRKKKKNLNSSWHGTILINRDFDLLNKDLLLQKKKEKYLKMPVDHAKIRIQWRPIVDAEKKDSKKMKVYCFTGPQHYTDLYLQVYVPVYVP